MSWQLSTAAMEVLDDGRQRRYCRIIFRRLLFAAPSTSLDVEHVRIAGLRPRFVPYFSNHFLVVCSSDVTSSKPMTEPDCASVSGQAQIRPSTTLQSSRCHGGTPVRSRCVGRCAQRAPFTVNNNGIDARNGQAYHGRKTIATNGTRPKALGSRAREGQRTKRQWRRRLTSHVRPCPGAAGRTRVLRVGVEAAIADDSVRCLK